MVLIGVFVLVIFLVVVEVSKSIVFEDIKCLCCSYFYLIYLDEFLVLVCDFYVELIYKLVYCEGELFKVILEDIVCKFVYMNLVEIVVKNKSDIEIVGCMYLLVCYILDVWFVVLYFVYCYVDMFKKVLIVNINVGGDNVYCGFVLGVIMGLI